MIEEKLSLYKKKIDYYKKKLIQQTGGKQCSCADLTFRGPTFGMHVNNLVFSPDGTKIACGSSNNTVQLWDSNTGKLIHTMRGHAQSSSTGYILSLAFTPNHIISGSDDGLLLFWSMNEKNYTKKIKLHSPATSLAFWGNSTKVACGLRDGTIRLLDIETKKFYDLSQHTKRIVSLAFSPNGKTLAAVGAMDDISLWDISSMTMLKKIPLQTNHGLIAFAQNETQIFVAYSDNVQLLDIITGKKINEIKLHGNRINCADLTQNLVVYETDWHNVRVVDIKSGAVLHTLETCDNITSISISPDNKKVVCGNYNGLISMLNI
jgi:WD40 repeat protein